MTTLTFLLCNINTGHQLTYWWLALTLLLDKLNIVGEILSEIRNENKD